MGIATTNNLTYDTYVSIEAAEHIKAFIASMAERQYQKWVVKPPCYKFDRREALKHVVHSTYNCLQSYKLMPNNMDKEEYFLTIIGEKGEIPYIFIDCIAFYFSCRLNDIITGSLSVLPEMEAEMTELISRCRYKAEIIETTVELKKMLSYNVWSASIEQIQAVTRLLISLENREPNIAAQTIFQYGIIEGKRRERAWRKKTNQSDGQLLSSK